MRDNPSFALENPETVKQLIRDNLWARFITYVPGQELIGSGYISPGWYESGLEKAQPNVPTWNFTVAHLHATAERSQYAPHVVTGTVGFRMPVQRFEAKEKMSQNKPVGTVHSVISHLREPGVYSNPAVADRMESVNAAALAQDDDAVPTDSAETRRTP